MLEKLREVQLAEHRQAEAVVEGKQLDEIGARQFALHEDSSEA